MKHSLSRRNFLRTLGAGTAAMAVPAWLAPNLAKAKYLAQDTTTISMASNSGGMTASARFAAELFEAETGIRVEISELPYATLREQQTTALVGGSGAFDVLTVNYPWLGQFSQYITPVSELEPDYDLSDFIDRTIEVYSLWDDVPYTIPYQADVRLLWYRTDLVEQVGMSAPTTLDELMSLARAIQEQTGIPGMALQGKRSIQLSCSLIGYMIGMGAPVSSVGGPYLAEDYTPTVNSEAGRQALDYLLQMREFAPIGFESVEYPEALSLFTTGQVGMTQFWPELGRTAEDPTQSAIVGMWEAVPVPGGACLGGWGLAVAESSANREAAWEFVKYLTSQEISKATALESDFSANPSRTSVLEDEEVIEAYSPYAAMREGLATGGSLPRVAEFFELDDRLQIQVSECLAGNVEPDVALETIESEWIEILTEAGYLS